MRRLKLIIEITTCAVLVLALLLGGLAFAADVPTPLQATWPLVSGWLTFLPRIPAYLSVDPVVPPTIAICFVALAVGIHGIGRWLYRETAQTPERQWKGRWTISILLGLLLMFAAGISLFAIAHQTLWLANSPRPLFMDSINEIRCASQLRQIGQAITNFASRHDGRFPDSLQELCEDNSLEPALFVCPQSGDRKPEGDTREWAAQLSEPGHCSYRYAGRGMSLKGQFDPGWVLLYEFEDNHEGGIGNALYADGHVDSVRMSDIEASLAKFSREGR